MNQKELKDLIEFLIEKDVSEFELERGDVKVRIKRTPAATPVSVVVQGSTPAPTALPVQTAASSVAIPPAASTEDRDDGLQIVKSPIVGTYYESPSPGSPPFIKVGDVVAQGQALCIIEAMKLMNEIESDYAGEVAKILVKNGQPVEYGQPLFAIRAQ